MAKQDGKPIYWSQLSYEHWNLYVAATGEGLCFVGSPGESLDELEQWAEVRHPGNMLIRDDDRLDPYIQELTQYLQGVREDFTVRVDYRGTPFQEAVWRALCDIPYGQTRSYSEIADSIQKSSSVRAVGAAIGANPILMTVPCHRVIGKNGALTGYRGGMDMKEKLLRLEQGYHNAK